MKKLRGVIAVFIAAMTLVFAAACGAAPAEPIVLDIPALTAEIVGSAAFTDSMGEVSADTLLMLYGVEAEDVTEAGAYFSSMATAEECVIFKAADDAAAERLLEACLARQDSQTASYENYVPSEVAKIESAIIAEADGYVMYIVSSGNDVVTEILAGAGVEVG